ncbi:hypothetical protein CEXT_343191 [Caerostris extrusa]|uniref:Uncharacterized protein n=1 Tax=Caerostris extrusa TaxID=172846 RepID=A0AAV4RH16_CAEEX|nr:hypothetical protein CEXT_343191 [Caerostris extrusa]
MFNILKRYHCKLEKQKLEPKCDSSKPFKHKHISAYTNTLVTRGLLSPGEPGAVNFNVLRILLKSVVKKARISTCLARYSLPDAEALLSRVIHEKGEITLSDKPAASSEGTEEEDEESEGEDEEGSEDEGGSEDEEDSYEEYDVEDKITGTDREIWPAPELDELFTAIKALIEQTIEKLKGQVESKVNLMNTKMEAQENEPRLQIIQADLTRSEFEQALEDIGDAIGRLSTKLKEKVIYCRTVTSKRSPGKQ